MTHRDPGPRTLAHGALLAGMMLASAVALWGCGDIGNVSRQCSPEAPCECDGTGNCEMTCPRGGCDMTCDMLGNCVIGCSGGHCRTTCEGTGNCVQECEGGGCMTICEGTGNCVLDCPGGGCEIECNGTGQCTCDGCG